MMSRHKSSKTVREHLEVSNKTISSTKVISMVHSLENNSKQWQVGRHRSQHLMGHPVFIAYLNYTYAYKI